MDLRVPDRLPPELLLEKEAVWRVQDQGDGRILRGHATRRLGIRESGFARQSEGGRDDVVQLADVGVARTGTDTIKLYLLQPSNLPFISANPGLFFVYFHHFQSNITILTTNKCE